jgi:FtsP/CotA-like multicopper oxidase with cupredoxin domain
MKNGHFPDLLMSRRRFLGLGAGALAAIGLGSSAQSTPFGSYFYEPEVRSSANGFLSTTLRASSIPTIVNGQAVNTSVYEGTFPGPTLRIRPGDFVRVELINDLQEETNLHVHGLHVTPQTPGDNVLLHIPPGERFVYEYTLPKNHPAGTYFYHPHRHGLASSQTFKGMSGMIIIEGDIDEIPGIAGLPERSLVLQRTTTGPAIGNVNPQEPGVPPRPTKILVNGAATPIMFISPGETQRWRLLNATVSSLWSIAVEGHDLTLISQDGNTLGKAVTVDSVDIATAQRRDVLIQGGSPGVYRVTYQDLQGPFATPTPPEPIAYLVSIGPGMEPQPLPTTLLPFLDLRTVPVDRRRSMTFQIVTPSSGGGTTFASQGFVIDGKQFDENRIDQFVKLGATEEWTINNATNPNPNGLPSLIHPFHIHINPYQVVAINGQPYDALSYEDTTPIPTPTDNQNGSITFRTRFLDFPGTFVFHCHILGHEDGGMMGIVQVS